jgi:hypothetical protein
MTLSTLSSYDPRALVERITRKHGAACSLAARHSSE